MRNDILEGCDYNQLNLHTPVLNISSLSTCIWVHLPVAFAKMQLFEMYDISDKTQREVNFIGRIQQDSHPWIEMPVDILNWRSGKHTYRLDFLDNQESRNSLFISYIAQDDNPRTPYVYMNTRGNNQDEPWKDGSYMDDYYAKIRQEIMTTYGYDPLLFGQQFSSSQYNLESTTNVYCSMCSLSNCENCPYKEVDTDA